MPTTYVDQFWLIDPFSPPPVGSTLNVLTLDIVDQNDNDLVDRFANDSVDGVDIIASYPGDTVTVTVAGGGTLSATGITFYLADGRQVFTPTDGSVLETGTLVSTSFVTTQNPLDVSDLGPPCFTTGTLIATPDGDVEVQSLTPGDRVLDINGNAIAVELVLTRAYDLRQLSENENLRPVRITAGALGLGLPRRDLLVSRQHRMLVSSKITRRMFGADAVLTPAIKLTELPGIYVDHSVTSVSYVHLLFDTHKVIFAENAPSESLYTGPEALKSVSDAARTEILTMFPEVAELDYRPEPALPIPAGKLQKALVARHAKNGKPMLELFAPPGAGAMNVVPDNAAVWQ